MAKSLWVRDRGIVACNRGLVYGETAPPCACGGDPPPPEPIPCCTSGAGSRCFWGGTTGQSLAVAASAIVQWSNTVACGPPQGGTVTFTDSETLTIPNSFANVGNSCSGRSVSVIRYKSVNVTSCSGIVAGRCYRYDMTVIYNNTAGGPAWRMTVTGRFRSEAANTPVQICENTPLNQYGSVVSSSAQGGSCGSASGLAGTNTIPEGGGGSRTLSFSSGNASAQLGYECSGQANRVLVPGVDFNGGSGISGAIASAGCSNCGGGKGGLLI